jgi:hypothetical protein
MSKATFGSTASGHAGGCVKNNAERSAEALLREKVRIHDNIRVDAENVKHDEP